VDIIRSGGRFTVYLKAPQFYRKHAGEYDVVVDEINTRPFMTPKFVNDGTPVFWKHLLILKKEYLMRNS